jgi:undecaprenyl-diphosphatase
VNASPDDAPWYSRFAARHPRAYLGVHGVGGIALVVLLVWAFAAIADEVPENGVMIVADRAVTDWLQVHGTEAGEAIFSCVSWLGAPVLTAVLVAAALLFVRRRDWTRASTIALAGGGGALLNFALKAIFHRGRPSFATEFISGPSWSFPSGHAMDSLAGYGILTYFVLERGSTPRRRAAVCAAASGLVLLVGFSRVYLGVHYLSDVVAGFIAGAAWLLVCIEGYRFTAARGSHG